MYRRSNILIYVFFLAGYISVAQTKEQKIAAISKRTIALDNDTSLKTFQLNGKEFLKQADEATGSLTGYFEGNSLRKIDEELFFSYGGQRFISTFYNGILDYAYAEEWHFPIDSVGNTDYRAVKVVYQKLYYFDEDKALDSAITGSPNFNAITTSDKIVTRANMEQDLLLRKRK
jgi:hypothetical protein